MLVVSEIPVVDVRGLLGIPTGRVGAPDWKWLPVYQDEFVRGLGPIRPRFRKGIEPWIGESFYVDSRQGIRFARQTQRTNAELGQLTPVFRRYYSDGTVGRLEIGIRTGWRLIFDGQGTPFEIAVTTMQLPMRAGNFAPKPFVELGGDLAAFLLDATTSTRPDRRPTSTPDWWVVPGAPMALCELDLDELTPAARLEARSQLAASGPDSALVEQRWATVGGARVSLWFVVRQPGITADLVRRTRIHISRLHSEHEALRSVFRLCDRGLIDVETCAGVRDYINDRAGFLLRRRFAGFPQRELLELVLDRWEQAYADDLATMRSVEAKLSSKGLRLKVNGLAELVSSTGGGGDDNVFVILEHGAILNMTDDHSTNISGNSGQIAGVQGGSGNQQTIGSIAQSQGDLAKLAEALVAAVTEARAQMGDAEADDALDYANVIHDESQKETPDPSKIKRFLEKVEAWAKKAGPPALNVVAVAAQVAAAVATIA